MSQESTGSDQVAFVERWCDGWNRSNPDRALSVPVPDVVYRPIASFAEVEECRGHDSVRRFFHGIWEAWADDAVWRRDTVRVFGDAVIGLCRFSGHTSGAEVPGGAFTVTDPARALAAVGVEE